MRRRALARTLADGDPAEVIATLASLIDEHRAQPTAELAEALVTLAGALTEPDLVPYPARAALYEAAQAAERGEVARMLFEGPPPSELVDEEQAAAERPLNPRGRPLSLGERKSLARGHRRDVLAQLTRDPHPSVIEILLDNPHVTERDVLAIATRRPCEPAGLMLVGMHEKWSARYPVKRALVLNPHTPPHLSVRIAATLNRSDLRLVAGDANLPDPLREQARTLLG